MKPPSNDRIFPIVALCTLMFGCFVFSEGRADIRGIPQSETFRRAEYPFARVLQTCTAWRKPADVSDSWGPVSFRAACQHHDKCFHTLGTTWSSCNRHFLIDLREACDRDLKQARLALGDVSEPDQDQVRMCYEIANLFHAQVQKKDVRDKFRFAQEVQKQYLAHVETALRELFTRVTGRVPSTSELADAKEALDSGMSFTDIEQGISSRIEQDLNIGDPSEHAVLQSERADTNMRPASYTD